MPAFESPQGYNSGTPKGVPLLYRLARTKWRTDRFSLTTVKRLSGSLNGYHSKMSSKVKIMRHRSILAWEIKPSISIAYATAYRLDDPPLVQFIPQCINHRQTGRPESITNSESMVSLSLIAEMVEKFLFIPSCILSFKLHYKSRIGDHRHDSFFK
jgi:hypothetical protein